MNIPHIRAGGGLFLAAKVGYVAGGMGTTRSRRTRTAGRLDAAAPASKYQILAEMRSMLRAFLPSLNLLLRESRRAGATLFAFVATSSKGVLKKLRHV